MLADLIQDTVRPLAAATPPPRGLPYLGLDHASGTSLATLGCFATRGIFRKYELVLDLGTPLGAVSRWLVSRLGGDAVAAVPTAAGALAASELTRRSSVRARVQCLAGSPTQLPLPSARFTHVWLVETLATFDDPAAVLREAFRVVRPGGWLGVQEIVPASVPGASPSGPVTALIESAGFFAVQADDVTHVAIERSPQLLAARARFEQRLRAADKPLTRLADTSGTIRESLEAGDTRVVQFVARRAG